MNTYIVTAADSRYFRLVKGLILSWIDLCPSMNRDSRFKFVVIDLGFEEWERKWLEDYCSVINPPKLEDHYSYLGKEAIPKEHWGFLGRALLPIALAEEFETTTDDVIVWLDSDTWVQNELAIKHLVQAASKGEVAAVPEIDVLVAYNEPHQKITKPWAHGNYYRFFGKEVADRYTELPMINNGVFSAQIGNALWSAWHSAMQLALLTSQHAQFGIDQISFNFAIYQGKLPFNPLPLRYNWMVTHCTPYLREDGKLVAPKIPYEEIYIIHLLDSTKWVRLGVKRINSAGEHYTTGTSEHLDYLALRRYHVSKS